MLRISPQLEKKILPGMHQERGQRVNGKDRKLRVWWWWRVGDLEKGPLKSGKPGVAQHSEVGDTKTQKFDEVGMQGSYCRQASVP